MDALAVAAFAGFDNRAGALHRALCFLSLRSDPENGALYFRPAPGVAASFDRQSFVTRKRAQIG